jgi:hypothetical protein
MRVSEALARAPRVLGGLDNTAQRRVRAMAEAFVDERVRCVASEREAAIAYRVLAELGELPTRRELVDPKTYRTDVQKEHARACAPTLKPPPFLRIAERDAPELIVGWLFRGERGWTVEVSERFDPADVASFFEEILGGLDPAGVPRVVHEGGVPRHAADGSLVLDGVVRLEDGDPLELVRSAAAFAAGTFHGTVVETHGARPTARDLALIPD